MMKVQAKIVKRISKPVIFIVIFIAFTLVLSMSMLSVDFALADSSSTYKNTLTTPSEWGSVTATNFGGGNNTGGYHLQTNVSTTISDSSFSVDNLGSSFVTGTTQGEKYTTASYNASGFSSSNSDGWTRTASGTAYIGFFYTYALSESMYSNLASGNTSVTFTASGNAGPYSGSGEATIWAYISIGDAYDSDKARWFANYNETSGLLSGSVAKTSYGSFTASINEQTFSAPTGEDVTNPNKYMRIGMWVSCTGNSSSTNMMVTDVKMSLSFEEVFTGMSVPAPETSDNVTFDFSNFTEGEYLQSSVIELTSATTQTITDFGTADSGNGAYFSSHNSWYSGTTDGVKYLLYFYTFRLSDTFYQGLNNGEYTVTVSGTSTTDAVTGNSDTFSYLYFGLGYASNDDVAKSINGYKEIKATVGTGALKIPQETSNANPNTISNHDFSSTTGGNAGSGYKYLRVGMYSRPWNREGTDFNINLSNIVLTIAPTPASMSVPAPETSDNVTFDFSNFTEGEYSQGSVMEITSVTTQTVTDFGTADTGNGAYFSSHNSWYSGTADGVKYLLYFYTFKLSDTLYEELNSGNYTVTVSGTSTTNAVTGYSDTFSYLYLGLGYASSNEEAKKLDGFYELKATVGTGALKIPQQTSNANPNTISNYDFSAVNTNKVVTGDKYLRVGMYSRPWNAGGTNFNINLSQIVLSIQKFIIPGNLMSNPGTVFNAGSTNAGNDNGWNAGDDALYQKQVQNSIGTISDTGKYTRDKKEQYTLVEDIENDTGFLTSAYPDWRYYPAGKHANVMFIHTFKLDSAIYQGIVDGTYYVTLTSNNAYSGINSGSGWVYNWGYVGLGNAKSDTAALTYDGFKETSSIIGAKTTRDGSYSNVGINQIDSRSPISSDLKAGASQTLNEAYTSGTKYLRIAVMGEAYSNGGQACLDSISIYITIQPVSGSNTNASSSYLNNMTKPSVSGVSFGSNYYDAANPGSNSHMRAQTSLYTISNNGKTLTSNGSYFTTESGTNNVYQSGWGTSSATSGDFIFTSITNYSNLGSDEGFEAGHKLWFDYQANTPCIAGMFYTLKISENVYNALMNGYINITLESPLTTASGLGSDGTGHVRFYSYVGIGYATSDDYAKQGNAFNEIKGYVKSDPRDIYADDGGTNDSAGVNNISNFSFGSTSVNSSYNGNNNTKYLRFGLWAVITTGGSACSNMALTYGNYNLRLSPTTESNSPSFLDPNGSTVGNSAIVNYPITITDGTAIQGYTITDTTDNVSDTVTVSRYYNVTAPTKVRVMGVKNGHSYTITATDIWGNSSSKTFTYFTPIIKVNGYTDGVVDDYSGGGIGLAFGSDSGAGNIFAQLYQRTSNGTTFYVYAKPNESYYFAGFTHDNVFSSTYDTELSSSNGNYVLDTTNIEHAYKYTINVSTSSIPIDGVIEIQAYFKSIPTSGATSYEYDKEEKTVSVNLSEVSNILNAEDMGGEYAYVMNGGSSVTAPVNVGTYTATSYVTWNGQRVGKKTETITITARPIEVSFNAIVDNKTYDGNTSFTNSNVGYTWENTIPSDNDLLTLTYDVILSDKNVGAVDVIVSNLVFGGSASGNYVLNTTGETLADAVNVTPKDVNVTFTTIGKDYDGNATASVTVGSITGLIGTESILYNDLSATYADKYAGVDKKVTLTNPQATAGANTSLANYDITTNADSLYATISKIELTIDYLLTTSKVYDGNLTASVSDVQASGYIGDDNTRLSISVTATYDDSNASINRIISIVFAVSGTESINYWTEDPEDVSGIIEKRYLTITADDKTKVYGEVTPASSYSISATNGDNDGTFVTADDESASNITITIPSVTNAGNYTISATVENNNENYYLSAVDGSYTITKRPVTVTLKEQGGVYGTPDLGVDQGAYEVSANGGYAYLGDDLGISISKAGDMEVGAHALSATSSNTNHEVNFVIENNFVITKRDLTITLGAQGSVYGEAITLSNTVFTTTGLVSGDSVEVIISKADGTQKGEYALSGVLNTESASYAHVVKNYNYTIVPGIYTISRRAITIILAPQGSVYGITPVVNQGVDYFSLDTTDGKFDLASGDAKEGLNVTITKADGINAGEYELTFTWNNDNYEISGASGVYAITKATLDVTYVSETITYGGTPGYAVTYAGFKYTDNEDAVTTKATLDTANLAYTGSNITANGEGYQITPKGAEALNYDFNYIAGTLTVLKKNLSVAYIEEITYGQSPVTSITASEFTVTGLIGEEGAGVLTLTANLPTSAGTHTITSDNFTFQATNYEVTEVSGLLTINKAQLEVIIGAPSTVVHYGDSITLNVTYGTTGKNFVNGENADTALTQKVVVDFASITNEKGYVNANESGYDLATLISQEATADNYEIIHTAQILYVYKKELTLTYQGESKVYDALIPTPSKDKVVVSGLVYGESLEYLGESEEFDYNLAVNAPKAQVGEYLVYATYVYGGGRDALNNYDIKFVRDYYDITHATLTATYVSESIVFGATPTGAVVYSGFKGSDNEDVVITKATVSFESIDNVTILGENSYVNVKEGGYALAPDGASAVNYVFNYVEGTLTVTKREASLVLVDQTSVYGIAPVVGQGTEYYELTGLLEGDSLTSLTITKEEGITVGGYVLDAVVVAPNYEVAVTKATYTITQATLNVTISFNRASVLDIDVASLTTGDFTIEYAGWQYTDDESLLDIPVSVDLDAIISTATEAGEYTILYIVGNDDQYIFNYVSVGTIVVVASEKDVDISGLSFTSKSLPYNGQEQYLEVVWNDQPEEVDVEISYTYSKPFHKDVDVYSVIASFRVKTSGYKDNIPSMEASLTITALDVSLTLAPQGSVYGEAVEVKQGDEYYTVSGTLIEGDDLGVVITKSDVMNANHGEYDLDATISNTNYNLVSVTTNVYTISKVNLTVKLRNQVGGYGKTAQIAQGEYDIVAGALVDEGDMVITLSVETATLYEVGESYAITAEIVPNEWYVFDVIDAEYTVVAMAIQITLNNVIATYGDDVDATTTYTLTSGTLADEGDDLGLVFSITPADKYVVGGDYSISATASNDNYVVEVIGAKYVVEAKYIEIKVADQNSTYGEEYVIKNDFALVEGFSLEYDDEKKDLGVIVTVNSSSLNAGTHVLSATTSTTNYNVKVINGAYVIAKATTVFYTEKLQKEYTYTGNAINFKTDTSYVYTNRPNNQTGIKLPTVSVINAGHYTVTFSINESTNYASASVDVNIVVLKANPVVDMSVLLNKTYVYNGVEQYITASKEDLLVKADFDEVTLSWSGEVFKDVPETGNKLVELTLSETTNYFPATFTQTVPINKARYDFTGLDYAFAGLSKEYDGEECSVQVVNLPAGITVAYSYKDTIQEAPFRFKNAGDYIVKAIYSYDEVNYERPTELIETAYVQIERIDITVEVVDQHGYYGDAPEFDPNGINVIAGTFVEGDEIDLSIQLEPKDSYPIGVYKLVANTMASGNYNVTIASGSYTINPRPITVTINNEQAQYGDEEKPYSFKITEGTLIGEDKLKSTLVRETGKTPGEYAISGSVVNPNYIVKVIPGVYKIVPRLITVEVFNQEGTSAKQLNKRAYKTFGKILKGDNLNIQVVGEIGSTPGEYPLSATYTANPNYEVVIKGGVFIMRKVAEISVDNPIVYKLYDGVPYVFDVFVSSGAEPVFSIDGIFVENSFTEVGVYNLSINADVKGEYASPDPYRITFEIRPTVLETENDGVVVKVTKVDGFGAEERLEIEKDPSVVLSGEDFSSKIDTALTIYVVQGENRVPLQEYMQGREAHIKIKLNDQLTEMGAETWFVDSDSNVLYEALTPDEEGFVEVTLADSNHIIFVTQRNEATPILVVSGSMLIIFLAMGMFFLFRKKFIN